MNRTILFVAFSLFVLSGCGDKSSSSCCGNPDSVTATFAAFSKDAAFRNMHPAPLPTEVTKKGKMVHFKVEGGADGQAYLVKAAAKTNKYLLLFHEWWGLNDYIRNESAMWSEKLGVNVLALDLYDGKVAATADEAGKLMQNCDANRARAIIRGAAAWAGKDADFRTMGWCFGGGWSMQGALELGEKAKACVMYYGMPESDPEILKKLKSDVVFIHPKLDKWITAEVVSNFEKSMEGAGKKVTVYHYDADHAFANPSSPRYNEQAASEARSVVEAYLKQF